MNKLNRLSKEYIAKIKSFEDIVEPYFWGLFALKYIVRDETAYTVYRLRFKYLADVNETHEEPLPISGYLRPFFDIGEINHDMSTPLDFVLYLTIYADTNEVNKYQYKVSKSYFFDWFMRKYKEMDFTDEDFPLIVAIMSWTDVFDELPYVDVRNILLENTKDPYIKRILTGDIYALMERDLMDPRYWVFWNAHRS